MLRLSRLALAAGSLIASAGLAAAQPGVTGAPNFPPTFPRSQSTTGLVAAYGSHSLQQAGCSTCSPTATLTETPHYSVKNSLGHGGHGLLAGRGIGEGCKSEAGCSSYAAERTFFWGGCSQFFNPGNNCGGGLFGGRGLCGNRPDIYPPGPGGLTNPNPCVYGSYLNR